MMTPSRREFLKTSSVGLTAAASISAAKEEAALFSFGLMADCQYVDAENSKTRHYRESPRKLREAVTTFNQHELSCVLHLGDFIDRDFGSFDKLLPITAELKAPLHHALGNHDFDLADDNKEKVLAKLGLKRGYYAFRQHGVRFIMLDTTERSTYRHIKGSPEHTQALKELHDLFGHHPIRPKGGLTIWNSDPLVKLLEKHSCVKSYINGHHHDGAYVEQAGLHFLTLNGIVEKNSNAFAVVRAFNDRLELTGFGRQASRVMRFR